MNIKIKQRMVYILALVCVLPTTMLIGQEFELVSRINDPGFSLNDAIVFIDQNNIAIVRGNVIIMCDFASGKVSGQVRVNINEYFDGISYGLLYFWREKKVLYMAEDVIEGGGLGIVAVNLNNANRNGTFDFEARSDYDIIDDLYHFSGVSYPVGHVLFNIFNYTDKFDKYYQNSSDSWYLIDENYYLKWNESIFDNFYVVSLVNRKTKKVVQVFPQVSISNIGTELKVGSKYSASLIVPYMGLMWNKQYIIMDKASLEPEVKKTKNCFVLYRDLWNDKKDYLKYRDNSWPCRLTMINPISGESKDTKLPAFYLFSRYSFDVNDKGNMIVFAEKDLKTGLFKHWSVYRIILNGLVTENNVRLRKAPKTSGELITQLTKDLKIKVLDRTETKETINNLTSYWYKVRLSNGTEGWMFGAWLKIEE